MAVKKFKISSSKRANHLKGKKKVSKLTKPKPAAENILKKNPPKNVPKKQEKSKRGIPIPQQDSEDDEQIFENVRDILDDDDALDLIDGPTKKSRKRKREEPDEALKSTGLEGEYTKQQYREKTSKKVVVDLLPFKAKDGLIITRTAEVDYKPKVVSDDEEEDDEEDEDAEGDVEDSDEDILQDIPLETADKEVGDRIISTADLLIRREQEVERQRYRIGCICSGILEKPEDKMKNFAALFDLMDEYNENQTRNLFSVRKLAIISIAEVFKDILPEYRVGQVDPKMTTVRKTTLERITYETALLQQFKKYLQKTEKIVSCISKKSGHKTTETIKLAEVTVDCLCDILVAHPYFNYVQNVGQLLVYLLNCRFRTVREKVNQSFRELFKTDKKLDMSLYVIRRINHLIKQKSNDVHLEMISCLLALRIKNVNLDAEKEIELKQKKLEAHRQRLLSLSKKERKRRKKLTEVNRELNESRAEENKQTKLHKLTEITKMIFTIYFRLLKNDPNSKLLSACLEGLAVFAHVINIDFFSDLIEILNNLLDSEELGYREQLHCIHTIFVILSGQGEALNIDPIRFYGHLYRNLYVVNAGKKHEDFLIILRTLHEVLVKRRKNITQQRMLAFVKRLLTLSLHLLHNGTLASLGIIKSIMQLTKHVEILLDTDTSIGSGRYDPELNDPEYCNSTCTALYELSIFARHYHPTVKRISQHIAHGVPASGDGCLPPEIGKLTAEELFTQYDSSQMAFNPQIPAPNSALTTKIKQGRHLYLDANLKQHCKDTLKRANRTDDITDFRQSFYEVLKRKRQ